MISTISGIGGSSIDAIWLMDIVENPPAEVRPE
jgi:hypothetical protein